MATIMIISQALILGLLDFVDDSHTFVLLSFIAQVLGGLGAGANSTSSMAILSSFSNEEREKYIGIVEASFGLGLLFGPLIGAVFYKIGGYIAPFMFFGKSKILIVGLTFYV